MIRGSKIEITFSLPFLAKSNRYCISFQKESISSGIYYANDHTKMGFIAMAKHILAKPDHIRLIN